MPDSKSKYDVAILGWWYGKNYGSILTYYGLNRAVESLGRTVLMVHEPLGYNGFRVQWPADIVSMEFARRIGYAHTDQLHYKNLVPLNDLADTFVVGSDQLWNPLIGRVNDDLFLDFVSAENNRVSYGTSFGNRGTDKFKPDFVEKHRKNLREFKAVSVREGYAVDTARDIFGVRADLVVDPVFLLTRDHYSELAERAAAAPTGEYMAVFLLDPTPQKKAVAQAIASKLGFGKMLVIPNPDEGREAVTELFADEPRAEIMAQDAPENFLRVYRDAGYVVTDSFHGSAFASMFEKPFSSLYNSQRGADRFKNLLSSLGFDDTRRVFETDTQESIDANPNVSLDIDFSQARMYIEAGRAGSLEWLRRALDPEHRSSAALAEPSHVTIGMHAGAAVPVGLNFVANSDAWAVESGGSGVRLRVVEGGAVRGNHVWLDLPRRLEAGKKYRLRLDWTLRTAGRLVNVHLRHGATGRFTVLGSIRQDDGVGATRDRVDDVTFVASGEDQNQVMFGALHFTGENAGADIRSITLHELETPTRDSAAEAKKVTDRFAAEAKALALHDAEQQVRAFAESRGKDAATGVRARMFFHAHAIEKGLTHSNFRPGFGRIALPGLAREMNAWLAAGYEREDTILQSSASVAKAYFLRNREEGTDVSHFWELFGSEARSIIDGSREGEGGVLAVTKERETPIPTPNDDRRFMEVMYGRRSVREFTARPVDDALVFSAVQIALQAPSVCSRQGARVHQFQDPAVIRQLLGVQGGFAGFEMPPRLLLVTADLDAFLFAPERNQPFVDGGLFMMSLLLGLTQVGLGSCLLNTAMGKEKEAKIRRLVDVPDNEVFIAFVAVGHYDEQVLVPRSKRVEVESILTRHREG